jgi:hypothetical protein
MALTIFICSAASFSFALDKKNIPSTPSGTQSGSLEEAQKTSTLNPPSQTPRETREPDPESQIPPAVQIQEGTNAEG